LLKIHNTPTPCKNLLTFSYRSTIPANLRRGDYWPYSDIGTYNNITINAKGLATGGSNVSYLTADTKWDGGNTALNATTGRTSLGLGTMAVKDTTAYVAARDTVTWGDVVSGASGKLAVFGADNTIHGLTGGTVGQIPKLQSDGTFALANDETGGTGGSLYSTMVSSANTTGQTLTNITGLSKTLNAYANYEFEAVLNIGVSADAYGIGIGMSYNGGAGAIMVAPMMGAVTNATSKSITIDTFDYAYSGWLTTSGQYGSILIKGLIYTGSTSQPLTVQFLKTTSGTVTVYSLSYLKAILIP